MTGVKVYPNMDYELRSILEEQQEKAGRGSGNKPKEATPEAVAGFAGPAPRRILMF